MDKLDVFKLTDKEVNDIVLALQEIPHKYSRGIIDFLQDRYKKQLEEKTLKPADEQK